MEEEVCPAGNELSVLARNSAPPLPVFSLGKKAARLVVRWLRSKWPWTRLAHQGGAGICGIHGGGGLGPGQQVRIMADSSVPEMVKPVSTTWGLKMPIGVVGIIWGQENVESQPPLGRGQNWALFRIMSFLNELARWQN
jgi:hypothetical protein